MNARPLVPQLACAAIVCALLLAAGQRLPVASAQERPAAKPASAAPAQPQAIPTKNMLTAFRDGGTMMYPIAGCSFALLVFVFERFIALRRGRVIPRPFVRRFLEQLREGQIDREKALKLCQENKSPIALVFAAATKKWGRT